jgi:glutamyl aminopeptidase
LGRLNEGFASYMEYKGVAASHPDWGMEDQFLIADLHSVMNLDATVNSHPIVQASHKHISKTK